MARDLAIEFARRRWWFDWRAVALFACAALIAAAALWQAREGGRAVAALQAELASSQRAQQSAAAARAQAAALSPERARAINDAIRRLNLPWADILVTLNKAATPRVALLAQEPDPSTGVIKLLGEARSVDAMLEYQRRLEALFPAAVLTRHEVMSREPGAPVRFSIETRWATP